jgi:hypothetical protein
LEPAARFTNFLVTGPDKKSKPRLVPSPSNEFLEIVEPPDVGIWSVKAIAADNRQTTLGFSVNAPRAESQFTPLNKRDLDSLFSKDNYKLVEDIQSHKGLIETTRLGYEIFPWLMFLILVVVTMENFLANTFYKEAPPTKAAGATSRQPMTIAT